MTSSSANLLADLRDEASRFGFDHLSVTHPRISQTDQERYLEWCQSGGAAGMAYMSRDPEKRSQPESAYPGVKSILTLAASYFRGNFPDKPSAQFGRVARYAWGEDYHEVIAERLANFLPLLIDRLGAKANPRVAVDTKPLLERALSASSKLGFIGKNTLLIVPQRRGTKTGFHVGSYVFLAEILLDVELGEPADESKLEGCGGCTSCLTACPTKAFRGPYDLDSGRCIAYLTIENKGPIPREMRPHIGDWVFGCDICQEVCPFNARTAESRWPEFHPQRGVGPWVDLEEILNCVTDAAFKARWGKTPLARPKRVGLIRNACVAIGNLHLDSFEPVLQRLSGDAHPLIREHALWALSKIMPTSRWRSLFSSHLSTEPEPLVRASLEAELSA